jgi:hypothetical protein
MLVGSLLFENPPWYDVGYKPPHLLFALGVLIATLGIGTVLIKPTTLRGVAGVLIVSYLVLGLALTLIWGFLIQFDWDRRVVIIQQLSLTVALAPYFVGYVVGWVQTQEPQQSVAPILAVTTALSSLFVAASWVLTTNAVFSGQAIGTLFSYAYISIFVILGAIGSTIVYLLWEPPIVQRVRRLVPV